MPSNVRQLLENGTPIYPITERSLVIGLQDAPFEYYVVAWDGASTPVVANIPAGVVVTYNNVNYTGTLAAGSATAPYLYLVASTTQAGEYDRYIVTNNGNNTFSWTPVGSTAPLTPVIVDNLTTNDATKALSAKQGKVLKDELSQFEAEVRNLSGRYYGLFASEGDLPEGEEVGYAFVGGTAPFAIYNFDGTSWSDSGASATAIYGEPGEAGVGFQSVASLQDGTVVITLTDGNTITIDLNHNHPAYYSKVAETSNPSGGFLPDVVYSLGTLTGTVTFALAAAVTGNVNHYFWMFDTGSTAPTITWPAGLTWAAGSAPTVAASKHYEVSILGGIAYYSEV